MKIRRDIASIPARSAKDTWRVVVDLVTGQDTVDRHQLDAAASIMESIIADEHPALIPIVIKGGGPRIVIYCLYNEDAMEKGLDVDTLNANPTTGDWQMNAPCDEGDVTWMSKTLKERAPRVTVQSVDAKRADEESEEVSQTAKQFEIDWGALKLS